MRVGLDATPLLGEPTGVGRYVAGLVPALAALPDPPALVLTAFTARGGRLPPLGGAVVRGRPVPARLLRWLWARSSVPPVELFTGPVDVFHATNFVLPPARRAVGVVTVHDLSFLHGGVSPDVTRYATLVPQALRRAGAVLTPSAAVREEVVTAYDVDPARVVVTPLGVDPAWSAAVPATPAWLAARGLPERYVLAVGGPGPRKNLPVLVDAVRRLGPGSPPLVVAGPPGPLPPGVLATGYLGDTDLRSLVAGAAVLAFPSRYEGFGLPPLEALACGVPVVASDLPVVREVTGGLARLVPVGDVDALAGGLADVLADPGGPAQRDARRTHAAGFTWARCAETTLAAYRLAVDTAG